MNHSRVATFRAVGALALPFLTGCMLTEGQRKADELTSQVNRLGTTLEMTKTALQETLDAEDALVASQGSDLTVLYGRFVSGIDRCTAGQTQLAWLSDHIQATASLYFEKWKRDLATITDGDLRGLSEDRMEASQKRLEETRKAVAKAREAFEPVLRALRDHAAYLANDLNAEAAGSLAKNAKKLRSNSDDFMTLADKANGKADEYAKAISLRIQPKSSVATTEP
ncbi:MAG TPA: DUF2959 family protein [Planctomycetota bacterium]|nr:DUF2959 family protein [Planctomycetota bacterium]